MNDGISKELASLSYVTVAEVAETVQRLGRGTLMAKMDIRQAYRNIPVHPLDRRLLGMLWKGKVYIDTTLPFGLRSAPLIFTAIADAAQWIMQQKGASHVFHYIDDYTRKMVPITGRAHSLYFWSFQQKRIERRGDRTTDLSIYPRL